MTDMTIKLRETIDNGLDTLSASSNEKVLKKTYALLKQQLDEYYHAVMNSKLNIQTSSSFTFSKDELTILKSLVNDYDMHYIAVDLDGDMYAYHSNPVFNDTDGYFECLDVDTKNVYTTDMFLDMGTYENMVLDKDLDICLGDESLYDIKFDDLKTHLAVYSIDEIIK